MPRCTTQKRATFESQCDDKCMGVYVAMVAKTWQSCCWNMWGGALKRQALKRSVQWEGESRCCSNEQKEKTNVFFWTFSSWHPCFLRHFRINFPLSHWLKVSIDWIDWCPQLHFVNVSALTKPLTPASPLRVKDHPAWTQFARWITAFTACFGSAPHRHPPHQPLLLEGYFKGSAFPHFNPIRSTDKHNFGSEDLRSTDQALARICLLQKLIK